MVHPQLRCDLHEGIFCWVRRHSTTILQSLHWFRVQGSKVSSKEHNERETERDVNHLGSWTRGPSITRLSPIRSMHQTDAGDKILLESKAVPSSRCICTFLPCWLLLHAASLNQPARHANGSYASHAYELYDAYFEAILLPKFGMNQRPFDHIALLLISRGRDAFSSSCRVQV